MYSQVEAGGLKTRKTLLVQWEMSVQNRLIVLLILNLELGYY